MSAPVEDQSERAGSQALIGRQAIVDRSGALVAYELLFRGGTHDTGAEFSDGTLATSNVILNTVSEFGVDRVLGDLCGYVNIGQQGIHLALLEMLPPQRFTLELLETVQFDEATIAECRVLKKHGYRLALDDVTDIALVPRQMLELADVVKVDVGAATPAAIDDILAAARCYQFKVLAEKVETAAQHLLLRELGFDLFQGYFFARPEVLAQRRLPESTNSLFTLLQLLTQAPSVAQLESVVKKSPLLLTRLMKLAQSAAYGDRRGSTITIRDAIMRVGTKTLGRWAELLLFVGAAETDLATNPLFRMVAVRARFMELLAKAVSLGNDALADAAYQTGVYSLLHVLAGQTQDEFMAQTSVPEAIRKAIAARDGVLGQFLGVAEALDLDCSPPPPLLQLGLSEHTVMALHCQATLAVALDVRA
ncbi:Diguanylate phosphodiesterase [Ralstonia mannitolilytica]|uniref:EAL and HDOD domain-containing protein n=1 Tax=Ralstonia mannitolilytica TaxID=105219 RepID=UPI000AD8B2BF|nr:Cyclic di-GMP phosphodiesterase CdgJ [Ralstonia mannitolilytica]CAJ0788702.1 Cyclic di-GMP phosphodiesterase CdgJ [Ralstonia mannitolilytica]